VVDDLPERVCSFRDQHVLVTGSDPNELVPLEEEERRYVLRGDGRQQQDHAPACLVLTGRSYIASSSAGGLTRRRPRGPAVAQQSGSFLRVRGEAPPFWRARCDRDSFHRHGECKE
jgi:hypothetical protein